jgi:hypothetical protein
MNPQIKTILLTILTLSCFTIALVELSGVSSTALFNKYGIGAGGNGNPPAAQAQTSRREEKAAAMPKTMLVFTNTKYDFGTITEGDVVKHAYHFKNAGNHPLLITRTDVSCGCTTPSFPKEPIPPGGEGDVVVQFNSSGKSGQQHKNVLVHSNAQEEAISIGFDADVKEK